MGLNNCMSQPRGPCVDWIFEYQPKALEILTQLSRYKRAESNLLLDKKDPQHWIQLSGLYIYSYTFIV